MNVNRLAPPPAKAVSTVPGVGPPGTATVNVVVTSLAMLSSASEMLLPGSVTV